MFLRVIKDGLTIFLVTGMFQLLLLVIKIIIVIASSIAQKIFSDDINIMGNIIKTIKLNGCIGLFTIIPLMILSFMEKIEIVNKVTENLSVVFFLGFIIMAGIEVYYICITEKKVELKKSAIIIILSGTFLSLGLYNLFEGMMGI